MLKKDFSKIAWIIIIVCFIILIIVGQYKIKKQNTVLNTVSILQEVQKYDEKYICTDEQKVEGYIVEIAENSFFVNDSLNNVKQISMDNLINYRTREKIDFSHISVRRLL